MTDVAEISLKANSSGVDRASRSLSGLERSAKRTEGATARMNRENQRAAQQFRDVERASRVMVTGLTLVGGALAAWGIRGTINDVREFESGLVGVAKTTGMTGTELEKFSGRIDKISRELPVATSELLELSRSAGQMGVTGSDNIEKFAVTIAKMGTASDLAGEQAASALSRILNVTGESTDQIDVLASVIVSLGNSVAATESEIANITNRVAQATSAFGLSSAEAAALGAALRDVGVRAEAGGTAMGQAFSAINNAVSSGGDALDEFSDALDLNGERLAEIYQDDKIEGFQFFLEEVGQLGDQAGVALENAGLGGVRLSQAIIPLANNTQLFADTLGLANDEVRDTSALEEEFAAAIDTFDNRLQQSMNILSSFRRAIGSELTQGISESLDSFNEWANEGDNFEETAEDIAAALGLVGDAAKILGTIFVARLISSLGSTAAEFIAARAEAVRYQSTLAGMAGVSKTTAAATGTLRGALALVGGPAGAATVAGIALFSFREELGLVPFDAQAAVDAVDNLADSFDDLTEAQARNRQLEIMDQFRDAVSGMADLQSELESVENLMLSGTTSETLRRRWTEIRAELDTAAEAVTGYAQALSDIEDVINGTSESTVDLDEVTREFTEALDENATQSGATTDAFQAQTSATNDLIQSLRDQLELSRLSARQQATMRNLQQLGIDATIEQRLEVMRLSDAIFRAEEASRDAGDAQESMADSVDEATDALRAQERMLENIQREWGEIIYDLLDEGELRFDSFFDSVLDGFKRMVSEMAAKDLMGVMFGGKDVSSLLDGSAAGALGGLASGAGQFLGGLTGSATGVAAGTVGPPTAAASSGAGLSGALSAIPGWGWALGGLGAAGALMDSGGSMSHNAGMLVGDAPGVDPSRTFDVDPFASGFAPTGMARRTDQQQAVDVIDQFRAIDSEFAEAVRELGGTLDLSRATLGGLDEQGRQGGVFMGLFGEEELTGNLEEQVGQFVDQLVDHVGGLEDSLIETMKAAESTDEVFRILRDEIDSQDEAANDAAGATSKLNKEEAKLTRERTDSVAALADEMAAIRDMRDSLSMQSAELLGASPLREIGETASDQLEHIEEQRRQLVRNHEEEIRAERRLHEQRMKTATGLDDFIAGLQLGDQSALGPQAQLDIARERFEETLSAAQGGDVEAAGRLQDRAQAFIDEGRSMFASSSDFKDIFQQVTEGVRSVEQSIRPEGEFDPSAANQRLVDQLEGLDTQLEEIAAGVTDSIVDQLGEINVSLDELNQSMRSDLVGAIGEFLESDPAGGAVVDALGGIEGSVDTLPPRIASSLSSIMRQFLNQSGGSKQRTTEEMPEDSIPRSAAEQFLESQGYNLDFSADEIQQHVDAMPGIGSGNFEQEVDAIRRIGEDAIANNVSSQQLADVLGYTQQDILDAAELAGLPQFADGGRHTGGWAIAGEEGPELINTGPAQIFSNEDSRKMMAGSNNKELVEEVRALREEVTELRRVNMMGYDHLGRGIEQGNEQREEMTRNMKKTGVGSARFRNDAA